MSVIMKKEKAFISNKKIITYGLTNEENDLISKNIPTQNYEIYNTDEPIDLIAVPAVITIVNACKLAKDSVDILFDYYTEVNGCTSETIIWLGKPFPPKVIQKYIKCYENFESIRENIKYILLNAHKQNKRVDEFSKSIMYALKILGEIRRKPGIKTKELSEICEISTRSVQRYIETLRLSGEWIEYDTSLKGWKLYKNISSLIWEAVDEEFEK